MKKVTSLVLVLAGLLIIPFGMASAQTATVSTSTTQTVGTISEFSPDTIVIKSETSTSPNRYNYSEKTTYVDETGSTVSRETVKSVLPVTVYYTCDGDRMIANKVVVRKSTTTTGTAGTEEKRTTTKTTTERKY